MFRRASRLGRRGGALVVPLIGVNSGGIVRLPTSLHRLLCLLGDRSPFGLGAAAFEVLAQGDAQPLLAAGFFGLFRGLAHAGQSRRGTCWGKGEPSRRGATMRAGRPLTSCPGRAQQHVMLKRARDNTVDHPALIPSPGLADRGPGDGRAEPAAALLGNVP